MYASKHMYIYICIRIYWHPGGPARGVSLHHAAKALRAGLGGEVGAEPRW